MTKPFLAGLLSLSLALSGAAPAQADNRDTAKIVAAIAALTIIGAAINNNRNNRNDRRPAPSAPPRLEPLPSGCVFEFWGDRGPDHALASRCVSRELRHPERLPQACATEVEVMPWQDRDRRHGQNRHDRWVEAYDISCLYRAGYRFDR
jgi:hypothetical protein